ncbi:MAG: FG-GAP-like repeat-containing protein [Bacteroidota bacterium]|nr:FG-GAP-like repeat-containing protein [Bacteroidota bacterium]
MRLFKQKLIHILFFGIVLNSFAQLSFTGSNQISTFNYPFEIALLDINNDTYVDAIITNSSDLSVLLGTVSGGFGLPTNYTTGSDPRSVLVIDVNNDGLKDIVTGNNNSNNISVLINQGNGTFGAKNDFAVGNSPYDISYGDFNNDTKVDIAVANYNNKYVTVLTNTGSGSFALMTNITTTSYPRNVAAGDLNGDGRKDIVITFYQGNVCVFTATGSNSFGTEVMYTTGSYPYKLLLGDVNSDSKLDVITVNNSGGNVSVLTGTGTGTLGINIDYLVGSSPQSGVLADFNKDGKIDILVTNYSNKITVLTNSGTGAFSSQINFTTTGNNPQGIAAADLNADTFIDIAITNYNSNSFSTFINTNGQTLSNDISYGSGKSPNGIAAADFNGDGKIDFAVSNSGSSSVSILTNNGNGIINKVVSYAAGSYPYMIVTADFNGDGKPDIAYTDNTDNNISVRFNNGNGTFGAATTYSVGAAPQNIVAADFNGDGKPDVAVPNYSNNNISVLLNIGGGLFGGAVNYPTGAGPNYLAKGDANGDGIIDLFVVNYDSLSYSVLTGIGNGSFNTKVSYPLNDNPSYIAVYDINNDNKDDVITTQRIFGNNGKISVSLNSISGIFGPPSYFGSGNLPQNISIGDFNGDNKPDISFANYNDDNISILINLGNGNFSPKYDLVTPSGPSASVATDINNDGKTDLVTVNYNNQSYLTVFTNTYKYLTVIANNASKLYGQPNPTFTGTILGANPTDNIIAIYSTNATQSSNVGTYPINISLTGLNINTYNLTTVAGTLTINPIAPTLSFTGTTSGLGGQTYNLTATSNSSGAISYSIVSQLGSNLAQISGNSLILNTLSGTLLLRVSVASSGNYLSASSDITFTIIGLVPVNNTIIGVNTTAGFTIINPGTFNTTSSGYNSEGAIPVGLTVNNTSTGITVNVFYREISSKDNFQQLSASKSNNTYNVNLDPTNIKSIGLEYYFEVNINGTKQYTDTAYIYLNFTKSIGVATPIKTGSSVTDYQLVSFPYKFSSALITNVMSQLGTYDNTQWRMFGYSNGNISEKNNSNDIVELAKGYWLITRNNWNLITVTGSTPEVQKKKPAKITLNKGWNILGNPYSFNVQWSDIIKSNPSKSLPLQIFTYKGAYAPSTVLPKYSAAWVNMTDSATIVIPVIKDNSINGARQSFEELVDNYVQSNDNWQLQLISEQGNAKYQLGAIGMRPDASDDKDKYDLPVLPRLRGFIDIASNGKNEQKLTRDISESKENYTWNFEINGDESLGNTRLSWNMPESLPLTLEDEYGKKVNMNQIDHIQLNTGSNFKIHYGSISSENEIIIENPYPNPTKNDILLNISLPNKNTNAIANMIFTSSTGETSMTIQRNLKSGINSFYSSVADLNAGIYLVKIEVISAEKTKSKTFKIIKL